MHKVWLPSSSARVRVHSEVAGGRGEDGQPTGSDLDDGVARHREDGPIRGSLDLGHRLDEAAHDVAIVAVQQRDA